MWRGCDVSAIAPAKNAKQNMTFPAFPVPPALLFLTAATAIEAESLLAATKARIYQPVYYGFLKIHKANP